MLSRIGNRIIADNHRAVSPSCCVKAWISSSFR
jgi:hypothetical protein